MLPACNLESSPWMVWCHPGYALDSNAVLHSLVRRQWELVPGEPVCCSCDIGGATAMVIGLLTLELHFPGARSLKDKRQALRSLETRLRNRFNVAVAEVEHQDLWQRARLAIVSVNTDHGHLDATLSNATSEAANARDIMVLDSHTEVL